jgi:hypothetical protein
MKKTKIIFWITTTAIFLFEGVMPALTSHTQMAIDGITHLGYPLYFVTLLTVFKVLGSIVLIVPKFPRRIKEWAYAGFAFDFISAFVSLWVVDGLTAITFLPLVAFVVLIASYICYDKINSRAV